MSLQAPHSDRSRPKGISRRTLLKGVAALPVVGSLAAVAADARRVAVIGAGAFGGWTALHLVRQGARVTLFDAWGPGNSRASSGGETRVIRATYGPNRLYVEMVMRALDLWRENEKRWGVPLFRRTGVLWMTGKDDQYERDSLPLLREAQIPFEELDPAAAGRRFPQINFEGVNWVIHEKEAGYLNARRACAAVRDAFVQEGGEYRQMSVTPGAIRQGALTGVTPADGAPFAADQYVFACGPWLGQLFPEVLGKRIQPTRQEVFFFGTPAGDPRFLEDRLPVWIDNGPRQYYGIPGNDGRGFKIADDTRGPAFEPTAGSRMPTVEGLRAAQDYLAFRFPTLKGAPVVETRVCQYENSSDGHLIIDRHPNAENVWLVGGGSGHGFKLGPAVGERLAELVLGKKPVHPFFGLARFAG